MIQQTPQKVKIFAGISRDFSRRKLHFAGIGFCAACQKHGFDVTK